MPLLHQLNPDEWQIVLWDEDRPTTASWIKENIKDAEGALVLLTEKINEELLEIAGPNLRIVSTMSVGYDHVETTALKKRNIRLGYTPDVLTNAVADLTVLLALMATRNAGEGLSIVKDGKWPQLPFGPFVLCGPQIGSGVDGKKPYTVGFIGFGRIAKATLKRLSPYGISRCIYANTSSARGPHPTYASTEGDQSLAKELGVGEIYAASLEYVAQESDLVIVLAPGGKETYHVVDARFLGKMKSMAVLVNTSRGTLVDTDALVDALKEHKIWAAGLDVVEGEPNIPAGHPLLRLPRAVVLPHIGSATVDTREAMARLAVENLINGLLGRPMEHEVRL
ncbi:related to glycerate dehydrogenase [Serendipita indica DSM 11827]|uniref:Related to glycerate dehydrogenase n=1 Tax=Serendipita indica (strain DSM 11827) TaxID=1109443 RepID=G4TDS2_SERID|nr:related to glycerate dehydrogenase [Serendipita indica DSM 11827]